MSNADVLQKGFEKAYKKIVEHLFKQMQEQCVRLLAEVPRHREFLGFTGNTQTSYACGLYVDGKLSGIVMQRNWTKAPLHAKVKLNEWVYLRQPYEGRSRSVKGKVMVSGSYGQDTSINFLRSYPASKGHIQIVMTTGTEYSVYLEAVAGLDVLTGTYEAAKEILAKGFKPIS